MSAEQLEQTLLQLLVPDSDAIKQATVQLKCAMADPGVVTALCQLLTSSSNAQVRQYAALLLRRKFLKAKQWNVVPSDSSNSIRESLLELIVREQDKLVLKSLAQLIATLAKHDLPHNRWPTLFKFLNESIHGNSAGQREVGALVLSCVASVCQSHLKRHMTSLLTLCSDMLDDANNHRVNYYSIQTMMSVVSCIDSDSQKLYESLLPKVVQVIRNLSTVDQEMAADALQILDELAECEISILQQHITATVQFCLQLGQQTSLCNKLRVKALSFISSIIRYKKKSVVKLKLVEPVLTGLFSVMCCVDVDDDDESQSVSSSASQVVDVMALHLPPEKFIPLLMKLVEPALLSTEAGHRKAGFLALAVTSEGCADYLRNTMLCPLLQHVYRGMSDESSDVRNAAMFALGQFSEHLQPDISKYSSELLPLLFDCLSKTSHDPGQRPQDIVRVYYATEMFCENLGKDICPYVPQLMDFLLNAINKSPISSCTSLAISAVGATVNAAGDDILPYLPQILEALKQFLVHTETEEQLKVQIDAIDALSVLARKLGEHLRPLAVDSLQLGLTLLKDSTDPDLRRSIYSLFGAVSTILKEDMKDFLEIIVLGMIYSIKSTEGITAEYSEQDAKVLEIFTDSATGDDEADEDEEEDITEASEEEDEEEAANVQGVTVENSFLDEKEFACSVLGELAINTGTVFLPYIQSTYDTLSDMLEYPASDLRRAAVKSLGQVCIAVFALNNSDMASPMSMLSLTVGKMLIMCRRDDDRQVAMAILDTLNELLKQVKQPVLNSLERPDALIALIKDVFQLKMACQDDDTVDELDEEEAEYDSALIEGAGELLPTLAKLIGGVQFAAYFAGILPLLLKKLKPSCKVAEKSFAIGTIAETIDALGDTSSHFVNILYPVVMTTVADSDEEVRSNAVFGLGVLAANGGPLMTTKFPEILKKLFDTLSVESDRRCIDNLCAAVCRMILAQTDSVPVEQVFPVILQHLPVKEDLAEQLTIFKCITHLYTLQHPQVMSRMSQLLCYAGDVLASTDTDAELRQLLTQFVTDVSQRFPDVLRVALATANQSAVSCLAACVNN